jgi:prepilin-type N-terminal cleavage/methylation domain-containing protein
MQRKLTAADARQRTTGHLLLGTGRSAFTLVELLVVIVIIGILAGLITVGASRALIAAKETRVKTEVDNLHGAIEAYKQKYGEYPPSNMYDRQALIRHIARAFPRSNPASPGFLMPPPETSAAEVLTIFLGGFTADPQYPFSEPYIDKNGNGKWDNLPASDPNYEALMDWNGNGAHDGGQIATGSAIFSFDKSRLTVGNRGFVYKPQGLEAPYVYFRVNDLTPTSYMPFWDPAAVPPLSLPNVQGIAVAYLAAATGGAPANQAANPESFQIISAGLDNDYGSVLMKANPGTPPPAQVPDPTGYKVFPTGTNYSTGDNDNITNFNSSRTLDDARP